MTSREQSIAGRRRMLISVCSSILFFITACGNASQAPKASSPSGTAGGPQTSAPIVVYSRTQASAENTHYHVRVSVSCPPGQPMLGGGFVAGDVFEFAAFISANYPSDAHTWTVEGSSISHFQLTAQVYCWSAPTNVGVQVVQGTLGNQGRVTCPAGTALLGGGFQTTGQAIDASFPDGNGWMVAGDGAVRGYALCATQRIGHAVLASAILRVHSSTNGDQPDGVSVPCPASMVATGGGFSAGGLMLTSTADATFATWGAVAGGDAQPTIFAVCHHLT